MVDGFGVIAAIDASVAGELVKGLTPAAQSEFGTEIFEEHPIDGSPISGLHRIDPAGASVAASARVAMCQGLPFRRCAA